MHPKFRSCCLLLAFGAAGCVPVSPRVFPPEPQPQPVAADSVEPPTPAAPAPAPQARPDPRPATERPATERPAPERPAAERPATERPAPARPAPATPAPSHEGRAIWVTRFDYGGPASIAKIMEKAHRANFNIVYFQVRGTGDAMYRSSLEPCSVTLCGALGGTPRYDPLEVAVREAHARGMELHAWMNALSGFAANTPAACAMLRTSAPGNPVHLLRRNPALAMVNSNGASMPCPNRHEYIWLSPAYAEVRTQLARVAADIARRYAIDGVHLDRVRYPGAAWSYDAQSLALFGRAPASDPDGWSEFRRILINLTVRETFDSIVSVRPQLALSAAVWGIYEDRWQWRSSRGRAQFMQDPLAWATDGYLDVAAPMTYYRINPRYCGFADWACLLDDHLERIQQVGRRHLYIGVDASKGGAEIERQVALGRSRGVAGFAVYSYGQIERAGAWDALRRAFASPAPVPPMPWKERGERASR